MRPTLTAPIAASLSAPCSRLRRALSAALIGALALAGCGGGGGGDAPPPVAACSVADQNAWLQDYMQEWYFWYAISPNPSPTGYGSVDSYFDALLYTGTDPRFPADRWSGFESTADFNLFFGDGKTLGYGLRVAGLEVSGQPDRPLYVRYVDPGSPAATAGLLRGDEVLSIDGRSAASMIAAGDFSALSPLAENETIDLQVRLAGGSTRTLTLQSRIYDLAAVPSVSVTTTPFGRRTGYVMVENMVSQANAPIDAAFAQFVGAGVDEVVLDLRYNGGGLVSVGANLASYVTGARADGQVYASLLYNNQRAATNNQSFRFGNPAAALGLSRVYVLAGPRTCSASEQVVNGLRPFVDVVLIGDTTCGKPVGFLPEDNCGQTYSVVNFESVNADNEGRYFDGLGATCPVAEDFTAPIGSTADPLMAAATNHIDTGFCPVVTARGARALSMVPRSAVRRGAEPGERQGMVPR